MLTLHSTHLLCGIFVFFSHMLVRTHWKCTQYLSEKWRHILNTDVYTNRLSSFQEQWLCTYHTQYFNTKHTIMKLTIWKIDNIWVLGPLHNDKIPIFKVFCGMGLSVLKYWGRNMIYIILIPGHPLYWK